MEGCQSIFDCRGGKEELYAEVAESAEDAEKRGMGGVKTRTDRIMREINFEISS